jgi:tripartite-type tricarboxylate transporter receptor subunit TctC
MKTKALGAIAAAVALATGHGIAQAQQKWPEKPVRMIVPFAPGGAADLIGRAIAQRLSESLGQPVIVDNRAGASGNIGAEAVAKAQADGYTILLGALTSHTINHTLERKTLRYDLERDLAPVSIVASVPFVLVVHPSVPAESIQQLVAFGKARPGHLSYGSSGAGAPQRLIAEMFKLRTGIDMLHVPYKGGSAQVTVDLIGGQIGSAFESVPATLQHIRAGKLRALAVTAPQRIPMLSDVPTMSEAGLSRFEMSSTFGILAPAGTPRPLIERLHSVIARVMQLAEVRERLLHAGAFAMSTTPEEAAKRIREEIGMWAEVIRQAGVQPE